MNIDLHLILHEALAGALFYSVFCRSIKTDAETTRRDVMLAIWMLGCVAIVMIAAPIVKGWRPDWFTTALLAAVVMVQLVTAKHWGDGVPAQFRKPRRHENAF